MHFLGSMMWSKLCDAVDAEGFAVTDWPAVSTDATLVETESDHRSLLGWRCWRTDVEDEMDEGACVVAGGGECSCLYRLASYLRNIKSVTAAH